MLFRDDGMFRSWNTGATIGTFSHETEEIARHERISDATSVTNEFFKIRDARKRSCQTGRDLQKNSVPHLSSSKQIDLHPPVRGADYVCSAPQDDFSNKVVRGLRTKFLFMNPRWWINVGSARGEIKYLQVRKIRRRGRGKICPLERFINLAAVTRVFPDWEKKGRAMEKKKTEQRPVKYCDRLRIARVSVQLQLSHDTSNSSDRNQLVNLREAGRE